jgi:hypothetical protein
VFLAGTKDESIVSRAMLGIAGADVFSNLINLRSSMESLKVSNITTLAWGKATILLLCKPFGARKLGRRYASLFHCLTCFVTCFVVPDRDFRNCSDVQHNGSYASADGISLPDSKGRVLGGWRD